jgi:hypothetical protein
MPAYTNSTAVGQDQIAAVIQQGTGLNDQLIYKEVLPQYGVNKRTAMLITATIAGTQAHRILSNKYIRQPGAVFERFNMSFGNTTFSVLERGWEVLIPDETEMDLASYFSVEALAASRGVDAIELTNEYLTGQTLQSTAIIGSATNALVSYASGNLATINFPQDVMNSVERGRNKGENFNTIIIPELVFNYIMQATLTRNFVYQQTGFSPVAGASITSEILQKTFEPWGISKVKIGRARYNTATDGNTTLSYTKCWSTAYITLMKSGNAFIESADTIASISGFGANIFWENLTPKGVYGVETYRDEIRKSNVVRSLTTMAPYPANVNCADLIATNFS